MNVGKRSVQMVVASLWIIFVVATSLFSVGQAKAEYVADGYPGQWEASPALVSVLEQITQRYWGGRGIALPTLGVVYVAPDTELGEVGGRGEEPGNRVWLAESELMALHSVRLGRREAAYRTLCETYIHERGHNAGLTHDAGWVIMAEVTGLGAAPRCEHWAHLSAY